MSLRLRPSRWAARVALAIGLLGVAVIAISQGAAAEVWPNRPVRMVVPFPAGGATDIIARLVSTKLSVLWGQPVVVDYRPGAGTVLGTDLVAKSAPDGYTLGVVISAHVLNPSLRPDLPYDTVKDLAGVSMLAIAPIVIVATPSLPADDIAGLVAYAKAHPGKLNYASPGTGTAMHLAGELLNRSAGIEIVHVPYKGGSPAYTDVIGGRVELQIDPLFSSLQNIRAGLVKALAITSPARAPIAPEIPTVAETLPGFSVESISGLVVPRATPRARVQRIAADVATALRSDEVSARMAAIGMMPAPSDPDAFDAYIRSEIAKWADIVKASNMKLD